MHRSAALRRCDLTGLVKTTRSGPHALAPMPEQGLWLACKTELAAPACSVTVLIMHYLPLILVFRYAGEGLTFCWPLSWVPGVERGYSIRSTRSPAGRQLQCAEAYRPAYRIQHSTCTSLMALRSRLARAREIVCGSDVDHREPLCQCNKNQSITRSASSRTQALKDVHRISVARACRAYCGNRGAINGSRTRLVTHREHGTGHHSRGELSKHGHAHICY